MSSEILSSETLSRETAWAYAETVRIGFRHHLATNPWRLSLVTDWPRGALQCLLFTLLGVAGGAREFAFVGSVAMVLALPTSVGVATVLLWGKMMGVYPRLRLGRLRLVVVLALHSLPWLAEAAITMAGSALFVGAVTGQLPLAARLLGLMPVFLLMAATTVAAALAIAGLGVGANMEILLGNCLIYVIIAAGGVVGPTPAWLDRIGAVLPIRNGLLAVRALLDGRPWAVHLLAEVAVGAFWAALAVLVHHVHDRRGRRAGTGSLD